MMHVAKDWYEVTHFTDGVSLIREKHVAPWLRCNIWHVRGRDSDLIIDTGLGLRPLTKEIQGLTERPIIAVMTHSHFDHAGGLHQFKHRCGHHLEADIIAKPSAQNTVADVGYLVAETFSALPYEGFQYQTYEVKAAPLTQYIDEGDVLDLGDRVFRVLHLPGHSPGSVALFEEVTGTLFSGDIVYDGELLDNLYHSNAETFKTSLARLKSLPLSNIHAGHFGSFGPARMEELIDEYLSGGLRIQDASSFIQNQSFD